MADIEKSLRESESFAAQAALARKRGDEVAAESYFRSALGLALQAVDQSTDDTTSTFSQLNVLRQAVLLALGCGVVAEARRLTDLAFTLDPSAKFSSVWLELHDITAWPDEWLVAAIRIDPPDVAALDALANRHWKSLFSRCQLLTLNPEKAGDLAQQAWCRVLRARHTLKPGGHFLAYLTTIATNLWHDFHRAAQRAGHMAEDRMLSLDATFSTDEEEHVALVQILPDLNGLRSEAQKLLADDIDRALGQLTPLMRSVLVARLLDGESCAEIGRRHGRTEQTISAWVRDGIRQIQRHVSESNRSIVEAHKV